MKNNWRPFWGTVRGKLSIRRCREFWPFLELRYHLGENFLLWFLCQAMMIWLPSCLINLFVFQTPISSSQAKSLCKFNRGTIYGELLRLLQVFCDYPILVTFNKIGEVHFRWLGTNGFHVRVRVVVSLWTSNMKISRRCFADFDQNLHQKACSTCSTIIFPPDSANQIFVALSLPMPLPIVEMPV